MEWRCLAVRGDGTRNQRQITAASPEAAAAMLLRDGWTPVLITPGAGISLVERIGQPVVTGSYLRSSERTRLTERLALLLGAGVPLDQAIAMLRANAPRAALRALFDRLHEHVRQGGGLAAAMATEPKSFPGFYIAVVASAERSGRLAATLSELAVSLTIADSFRRAALSALTYPAIVLATTGAALLIVLTQVMPQFEPMFRGEEARLPLLTAGVLAISRAVNGHPAALFAALAMIAVAITVVLRSGDPRLARLTTWLPGYRLREDYLAARLCRVIGALLAGGVRIVDAVILARDAIDSRSWSAWLDGVAGRLRTGSGIVPAFREGGRLPEESLRLIEIGAAGGKLGTMFTRGAELLEIDTRARLDRIVTLISPLATIVLGGLVALMIIAVMLGIFAIDSFALR